MSPDTLAQLLPLLLLVVLLYVLVIRPARRKARQVSSLQAALTVGDDIMLTSGIFGSIAGLDDDRVRVTVSDGVVLTVHRGAVGEIVRDVPGSADDADPGDPAETAPESTNPGAN